MKMYEFKLQSCVNSKYAPFCGHPVEGSIQQNLERSAYAHLFAESWFKLVFTRF